MRNVSLEVFLKTKEKKTMNENKKIENKKADDNQTFFLMTQTILPHRERMKIGDSITTNTTLRQNVKIAELQEI